MTENPGRTKPVTMEELAKLAGVHSRTVADALKGTGRVAPATREKVIRIAKELNYVPNAAARALATGRTGKVAVLSGSLNDHFYANAVHLLEIHLTTHGYEMMLLHTRREVSDLANVTKSSLVDGIILIGINQFTDEFLRLARPDQPCVFIDTSEPDFVDHITLDVGPAVDEALDIMLSTGRKRVAYVANNRNFEAHKEVRMRVYLEKMAAAGHTPEIIDVDTTQSPATRIEGIKRYLRDNGCPGALFCQNDESAILVYQALVGSGFGIPQDALLLGCDGLPFTEYFDTPISTISLPMEEICEVASQFLQNRMAKPDIPRQHVKMRGSLIIRKSMSLTD